VHRIERRLHIGPVQHLQPAGGLGEGR
jgi:hypothetical protein